MKASHSGFERNGFRALVSLLEDAVQSEPSLKEPLPDMPSRVYPLAIEFVEFAADGTSAAELQKMLSALCFREERRYRSKSASLWRQGTVNVALNTESIGFTVEARAEHGPCVCVIGLRVRDAGQTVALGAPAFSQPVGAGELDIPAIKGVGGSVVHFIAEKSDLHRVWDIEYETVPRPELPPPTGIRRIDHFAQTMRYEEMQSWLTYYTSVRQKTAKLRFFAVNDGIHLTGIHRIWQSGYAAESGNPPLQEAPMRRVHDTQRRPGAPTSGGSGRPSDRGTTSRRS